MHHLSLHIELSSETSPHVAEGSICLGHGTASHSDHKACCSCCYSQSTVTHYRTLSIMYSIPVADWHMPTHCIEMSAALARQRMRFRCLSIPVPFLAHLPPRRMAAHLRKAAVADLRSLVVGLDRHVQAADALAVRAAVAAGLLDLGAAFRASAPCLLPARSALPDDTQTQLHGHCHIYDLLTHQG